MIFRIASLLLSLSSLQFASSIEVSMIDMEDILENHRIVTDSSNPYDGSQYAGNKGSRGLSVIKSGLKKLLIKTANQEMDISSMDPSEWHEVQTTFLTGTSRYHQDHKHDQAATLVEDEVGFVALNTNEDAYFDHPDMKVPIREGAFIRFKGSDPHRTVVNKGSVHLLGPFDLKSFGKVGGGAPYSCCSVEGCFPAPDHRDWEDCLDFEIALFAASADCTALCPGSKGGKGGKGTKTAVPVPPPPARRHRGRRR